MMAEPARKFDKYTYQDYITWPEEEQWELIEGQPYNMTPAPSTIHQTILLKLASKIFDFLSEKPCQVFIAPFDVRLPRLDKKDDEIETVVQPDIVVVCELDKIDEKGCRGAPDIVIEIISPNTAFKDKKIKLELYEKYQIKEYWIVEPVDKTLMIFKLVNQNYQKPGVYSIDDRITTPILKGLEIDLGAVFQT